MNLTAKGAAIQFEHLAPDAASRRPSNSFYQIEHLNLTTGVLPYFDMQLYRLHENVGYLIVRRRTPHSAESKPFPQPCPDIS